MKIYVWGTGCGAAELVDGGLDREGIAAFVDSFPSGDSFLGRAVISPERLAQEEYDLVIVTSRQSWDIAEKCRQLSIDQDKLLFIKNNHYLGDMNCCYETAEKALGAGLVAGVKGGCRIVREPLWSTDSALSGGELENDYVRVKTLEAACRELGDVEGAAAELGVYRGGFARCINTLLPERKLYLFDSFEGFDGVEAKGEMEKNNCGDAFLQAHKNTAADRVLSIMPKQENVVIMPGFFPASLRGLEERFALVSIDVDFEDSIYEGLRYFVPRMQPGGYIFLHDYNSPQLRGVKAAVKKYERQTGQKLCAVPLCDVNGSLVICAPGVNIM